MMLTHFRQWLAPPAFENDEDKTRRASLLNTLLITSGVVTLIILGGGLAGGNVRPAAYGVLGATLATVLGLYWLMRRGQIGFASAGSSLALSLFAALALGSQGSVRAPGVVFFVLASVMAGLLINRRAAVGSAVLNSAIVFGLIVAEQNDWLPPPILSVTVTQGITFAAGAIFTVVLINLAMHDIDAALARARRELAERQQAERVAHRQLQELTVLHAVATSIVETAAEDDLLQRVTDIIGSTFYPVDFGVLLWEEAQQRLRIPSSYRNSSPAHEAYIPAGRGIVSQVAASGQARRVADVRLEPHYHAHVAATASELCVPIKAGDRMLGVINAESDQLDAFSEDDERLLLTIAGQLAAALEHLRTEAARQSMVARMEILHAIDTALLSAQSPQAMAQAAADGLRRLIACQRVSITPFNFQTGQAVYLAVSSATPTFLPPNSVVTLEAFGEHIVNGLRRDEPYLIEDVLTAEVVSEVDRRHSADGIRAWLCTPLFYQGQLTGALNLGYTTPGAYTPEQISIAREVADQLSIALQHARLHAETSETLAREQRLNEFVRAISRRLDVPAVLETAVRLAAELIGAESGSLSLMSPRRDAIVEVYDFNPPRGMESHRLPYSRGLVWLTYRTGEPLLTEAYAQHPEALPEWAAAGLRAYLAVPVSAGENRLGVLTLYNRESARPFTQRDLALAESIGRQVAVAVENARLFAAEQRRVALLTALHETGLDLSAQLDLPALLQTIMERAAHLLGATMGGFYLMEPDGKTLRHVANLPAGELNLPVKIGEGAVGQVAQHAAPLIIEDYHSWPGRLTDDVPFCGVVSVPILWQGRVLGVISICDPQPERFGPDDVESVRLLAAQAAVAITNARLYTEQQHELAERKRAEQALEENERTLRALLDAATDPVFLLDLNGTFLALNQALAKEFGQTVDAITGSYAYGWLPPELARQRKAQLDEVIRTGRPVRFADNNVGWYDNSIFPVFDAHGRVVRLAVYTRDITEYKRAEAALRQREVILETVALAAEQFLKTSDWRADINAILEQLGQKTGASHVYIFENHVTADGLPVTSQRYEWTAPGLQPEIDNPAFQNVPLVEPGFERWTEALQRGEPFYGNLKTFLPGEAGFLTPRGIKALLDVPIYVEGVWWGIIGFDDCLAERDWSVVERDTLKVAASIISAAIQRQRAEDAIRQLNAELERRVSDRTAQLEAANKELEAFSYSVSHDLRAPLRAIGGFARILQDEHAAQLTPEAQRPLGRILDNARRMSQLIDDLLNLSRLTRAALRRQPISLSRLAHEVVAAHQQREPHRQIECLIAPDLSVYGDPNLLKIVLENLLGNAWKFTIHQSQGRIEVGRLTQPDGQPVYFVRDNGAGFDMRYADKLFGAFQRLHGAEEFEGTGIGLATVQRIIHRHGGRVWAEGAVGAGAMFYFTLGNE